jgi:hypothetical protein
MNFSAVSILVFLACSPCVFAQMPSAPDWSDAQQTEAFFRSQGTLATLIYPPSAREPNPVRVELGWREMLEMGRMLIGELNPREPEHLLSMSAPEQQRYLSELWPHAALVIWTIVNRNFYVSGGDANCTDFLHFMRAFSQPINPIWRRDGFQCRRGGQGYGTRACSSELLSRRDSISRRSWQGMSETVRMMAMSFFAGKLENPDPRVVDFARYRRTMCRHPGLELRHHIWSHGFCAVTDPNGISVQVVPGRWARVFPNPPVHIPALEAPQTWIRPGADSDEH